MPLLYTLNGHEPQPCEDVAAWLVFMDDTEARIVGKSGFDGYHISTMFLGVDQSHDVSRPLLFETLVFDDQGNPVVGTIERADTWDQALQNHEQAEARVSEVVEIARRALKP